MPVSDEVKQVLADRIQMIQRELMKRGLAALVVCNRTNVFFLSGVWSLPGLLNPPAVLVPAEGRPVLVVPWLEYSASLYVTTIGDVRYVIPYPLKIAGSVRKPGTIQETVVSCLSDLGLLGCGRSVGVETDFVAAGWLAALERLGPGQAWTDASDLVGNAQAIKSLHDLRMTRRAAELASRAAAAALQVVHEGASEGAMAAEAARVIWSEGAQESHIVVGSGHRSSFPHPLPTDRAFRLGEFVLIDLGVLYKGYWVEIARTVTVGPPSPWQSEVFEYVRSAQAIGASALRPGASGAEVDGAIRNYFLRLGYDGEHFTHSSGHGLGISSTYRPSISCSSDSVIQAPTVVSLEPGLYFGERGGVRLEDAFYVGGDATVRWTDFPQSLDPAESTR